MEILDPSEMLESDRFSRKENILRIATIMFREKGYASSSVRDIAQEVGIEAPSIYSHFKSKEHILQHICFEMARVFMLGLERSEKEESPKSQLIKAIKEHLRIVIVNMEASTVMWNEWKYLTHPSYSKFQQMKDTYERRFEAIIINGIRNGDFRNLNSKITTNLILSSLNNLDNWYKKDHISLNALEKELVGIYLRGISKKN